MIAWLWKPWYVWRPGQIVLRAVRGCYAPSPGYRPLRLAWGPSLLADPTRAIGRSIWTTGIYDLAVSEVLARLVQPGDTAIDAGANVGYMTLLMALAAGPAGRVLAYEPHPELFAVLENNVDPGRLSLAMAEVILRRAALGERPGRAELHLPEGFADNDGIARIVSNGSTGSSSILVDVETLDAALGGGAAAVLKLDVEGFELPVLKGAAQALASRRIRHIVFEDHQGPESEAARLLESCGYRLYSIGWSVLGPQVRPIAAGRLAADYEAPSYLATLAAEEAVRRCSPGGWRVLGKRLTVPTRGLPCGVLVYRGQAASAS